MTARLALLCVIGVSLAPVRSQALGGTLGQYDSYGYYEWGGTGYKVRSEHKTCLALMRQGKNVEAYAIAVKLYDAAPHDPTSIDAAVWSAVRSNNIVAFLNKVAESMAKVRKTARDRALPRHLLLAYNYGIGALTYETDRERAKDVRFNPADKRTPAGFYYGDAFANQKAYDPNDVTSSVMFARAMWNSGEIALARKVIRECQRLNRTAAELDLILAQYYASGASAEYRGNKWVQPPPEIAPQPHLALQQAKAALKKRPTWPEAHFWVAYFNVGVDKALVRKHLDYYLREEKSVPSSRRGSVNALKQYLAG